MQSAPNGCLSLGPAAGALRCACAVARLSQRKQHHEMRLGRVQDFHTAVAGALSGAEYVERLFQAMAAEAADELAASEQRAAKRALRKAELKVRGVPDVL